MEVIEPIYCVIEYKEAIIMENNNLLNFEDLKDILEQLDDIKIEEEIVDEEVIASQRRYEQIIKKHKNDNLEL